MLIACSICGGTIETALTIGVGALAVATPAALVLVERAQAKARRAFVAARAIVRPATQPQPQTTSR